MSFEGTEGSGKSTLIQSVAIALKHKGYTLIQTREPGGTPLAEKLRSLLLKTPMHALTELFLYEAARVEHFTQVIQPALQQHQLILCDRFTDSTLAYQGYARKLPWQQVHWLNQLATFGVQPHCTIFLDIDPQKGLQRVQNQNRFEAETLAFHQAVRKGFLKARRENPKRWITLSIQKQSLAQLTQNVLTQLKTLFSNQFTHL